MSPQKSPPPHQETGHACLDFISTEVPGAELRPGQFLAATVWAGRLTFMFWPAESTQTDSGPRRPYSCGGACRDRLPAAVVGQPEGGFVIVKPKVHGHIPTRISLCDHNVLAWHKGDHVPGGPQS